MTRGDVELGKWETPIKGPGRYQVQFANVDERLSLVVDGREVGGQGIDFESNEAVPIPTAADLAPAAIAVRNASVVRERPCPEARYLLYPNTGPGRLWDRLGGSLSPDAERALRFPRRPLSVRQSRQCEVA